MCFLSSKHDAVKNDNTKIKILYPDLVRTSRRNCIKGAQPSVEQSCLRREETLCSLALKSSAGTLFGNNPITELEWSQLESTTYIIYIIFNRNQMHLNNR